MRARLETQDPSPRPVDRGRRLAAVPAPRAVPVLPAESDRPRPQWSPRVGAAVLLSVVETVRAEGATTSA